MDTAIMEQRQKDHAQRLEADRVFAALRQERKAHTTPPSPPPVQGFLPIPTLSHYLDLLALLGDSGPAPTDLLEAMERFDALRKARLAHPMTRSAAVAQGLGTAGSLGARPVPPQGLETTITQGLDTLSRAWQEASLAARQAFRQWVNAEPLQNMAPLRMSAQTQRYAAEIARICSADAASVG